MAAFEEGRIAVLIHEKTGKKAAEKRWIDQKPNMHIIRL